MLPDWDTLAHFHFLRPYFGLLVLPWATMLVLQKMQGDERDRFGGIIAPHLLEHLRLDRVATSWFNPRSVTALFATLMLIVLMGPTWRQQPSPMHEDEAALVIVLDLSRSMQQRDIQPSRIQRAKQKVSDLLALRRGKRAALIVYAGSAHTILSLTTDSDILTQYLAATQPSIMPRPGKLPQYVLPEIDRVLRQNEAPATIVWFTDGTSVESESAFSSYFAERPHQLLVVGTGSNPEDGITAPLEEDALKELAAVSGGRYLELTVDDRDMRRINRRIDNHFVVREDSALPWLDSGYVLLLPATALFLLWFRRGWTLTWSIVLLPIVLTVPSPGALAQEKQSNSEHQSPSTGTAQWAGAVQWFTDLWLTPDQQGRLLLNLGNYEAAAMRFQNPLWKGTAHYYAENFMLAAEYFSRSDSTTARFNEANARAHARDYLRALSRYDQLLAAAPDFVGAAENRSRVQELVDEINRLSESQQQEPGVSSEEKSLDGNDPIPAEGSDTLEWRSPDRETLTAQQLLDDPQLVELWLRGVTQDPSSFLATKFSMQLELRQSPGKDTP